MIINDDTIEACELLLKIMESKLTPEGFAIPKEKILERLAVVKTFLYLTDNEESLLNSFERYFDNELVDNTPVKFKNPFKNDEEGDEDE